MPDYCVQLQTKGVCAHCVEKDVVNQKALTLKLSEEKHVIERC